MNTLNVNSVSICDPFKIRKPPSAGGRTQLQMRNHLLLFPHQTTDSHSMESAQTPTTILSQLPINIISVAGQLVIICLVLLGSSSHSSSDSINDLNNGPVIIDADNFESYLIPRINSVCWQYTTTSNHFIIKTIQDYQIKWSHN